MIAALEKPEIRKHAVPLTIKQYHTLVNQGALSDDVEFIRGALIEKMPKSPLHEYVIAKLLGIIAPALDRRFLLRKEGPISTVDSEPEPDISIVKGKPEDFLTAHPVTAEFIAEIAVSSHDIDFAKAEIYAEAGVLVYAIFDTTKRLVHLHERPEQGRYREVRQIDRVLDVTPLGIKIDLKSVFPPEP